jgi:methionyl aminopeptidase
MPNFIKTREEIERIRVSGGILGSILRRMKVVAVAGVSLLELDALAREMIKEKGARPAFLGYRPGGARSAYPSAICASVNEVIVHGKPSQYKLVSGDVLKVDVGVNWQGGISDAAVTIPVGSVSKDGLKLIKATENALNEAIRAVKPGNTLGDIGYAVERTADKAGFYIAEGLTGHGVGTELQEDPVIYNYGKPKVGMRLKAGMVLAIEPMLCVGTPKILQRADDSFITADKSLSAHFEHTILVTETGAEVLTN